MGFHVLSSKDNAKKGLKKTYSVLDVDVKYQLIQNKLNRRQHS